MFGWSAMAVAVFTGVQLAIADGAFDDACNDFDTVLVVKIAAVGLLVAGAIVHDFVLGPRLARQIREAASADDPQAARRRRVGEPCTHADGPGARRGARPFIVGGCNRIRAP